MPDDKNQQEDDDLEFFHPRPQPPRNLDHYLEMLSRPRDEPENNADKNANRKEAPVINLMPVEVLLQIFTYLDDLSIFSISQVCKKFTKIVETHTPQTVWKKYIFQRFPLYQQISTIPNWFHVSWIFPGKLTILIIFFFF